jgi:integrase
MGKNESRRGRGEGALFYREDRDRWMGRVVVDGKRHQISAKTKTEARRKLEELRRTASDGLPVTPGSLTVAELLEMWSTKALPNRRLSPSRLAGHRWAISILNDELGTVRLRNLTADRVEAAFARRAQGVPTAKKAGRGRTAGAPLTKNSLVKIRSTLNQALTWAQRRDLVARNIAPTVEIPHDAAPSRSGKTMTVDQAQQFLAAAAGTELEAMWTVMIYLGVRPGEAAGIAWSDIDFGNGIVHVWRARKASDNGRAIVGETKNTGSVRSLDAPSAVLTALRRHRDRQHIQIELAGTEWFNEDDLVFTSPTGRPTDPKAVRKEFERIVDASGIEGHWTPNLLRHTAASLMAHAGMPIEQVADQLGHTDLRMLQQHYRHRIKRTVDGASAVEGLLNSDPTT